jgi:hypothetical protein
MKLEKLLGLYFDDFAAFVMSTLRAGAVRLLALVAIRALRERGRGEKVVGAAARGACFRVAPFWIRHEDLFVSKPAALPRLDDLAFRS